MIVIYIIGGIFLLALAIFLLDRREKMTREIKKIQISKDNLEETNRQLDDLSDQLSSMNEPLMKLNTISKKILSYRK